MVNYASKAAFVMPHYSDSSEKCFKHLAEAVDSVVKQTDEDWYLIIIDDASVEGASKEYLKSLKETGRARFKVIFNEMNVGPGICRNQGISLANELGCPFILFIDSDDLCCENRLKVTRKIFSESPNASVVYSTFDVINETSELIDTEKEKPFTNSIVRTHKVNPPQGRNAWINIATEVGYTNLTSSTSVLTSLAMKYPFPNERVSEDAHTWLRYSAGGGEFIYTPEIPARYRLSSSADLTESRKKSGGLAAFNRARARVEEEGFKEALNIALENGKITENDVDDLLGKFFLLLSKTM